MLQGEKRTRSPNKTKPASPPGKSARKKKQRKKPGLIGRAMRFLFGGILRLVWAFSWRISLIGALVLALATGFYYIRLPAPENLFDGRGGGSVTMLDRDGNVFAWRGEQYGGELKITEVSPHVIHAVVAAEDKRYYDHFGIDPIGITRAMVANLRAGRLVQGGSTLTQQVAKNVYLTAERSLERKLKELPMALALELKYTKEQILSVYINRVYLGAGTYGFEAASQRYFGKSARVLNPAEAAMLAGLLRAPSRYAPTNDLGRAQGRASVIIRLMEEHWWPDTSEGQTVRPAPLDDCGRCWGSTLDEHRHLPTSPAGAVLDRSGLEGVERVVAPPAHIVPWMNAGSALAHDDGPGVDDLTVEHLGSEPLGR